MFRSYYVKMDFFAYVWQSNGKCIDHTVFVGSFEQRIKDNFQHSASQRLI